MYEVPSGAEVSSYIHTHPNGLYFSEPDYKYAKSEKWSMYVVVQGDKSNTANVIFADKKRGYESRTIATNMAIEKLTSDEMYTLEKQFIEKWKEHITTSDGFGCENKAWPRIWLKSSVSRGLPRGLRPIVFPKPQ